MEIIHSSGHFSAFASKLIHCCLVIVTVGPIRYSTAENYSVAIILPGFEAACSLVWSKSAQTLYFIDASTRKLCRYNVYEITTQCVPLGTTLDLKFLVPVDHGPPKFIVGSGSAVSVYPWDDTLPDGIPAGKQLSISSSPTELVQCGKVEAGGRLWVGSNYMDTGAMVGCLYSVDAGGTITTRLDHIGIPGGIAWSVGYLSIFYSDKTTYKIVHRPFNKNTGQIGAPDTVVFDFTANGVNCKPGDMTIDNAGKLWVVCIGDTYIVKIDPDAKKLLTKINIPGTDSTTSVVFAGTDLQDLYVTTRKSLFVVTKTGSRGVAAVGVNVEYWP